MEDFDLMKFYLPIPALISWDIRVPLKIAACAFIFKVFIGFPYGSFKVSGLTLSSL
jgi:hypothetical protein